MGGKRCPNVYITHCNGEMEVVVSGETGGKVVVNWRWL